MAGLTRSVREREDVRTDSRTLNFFFLLVPLLDPPLDLAAIDFDLSLPPTA
jgi:hypothetical protein